MYCTKCGRKLEDNASFCVYCGAKTEKEEKLTVQLEQITEKEVLDELGAYLPPEENVVEKKKSPKWIVLIIVLGGVSVLLAGLLLVVFIAAYFLNINSVDDVTGLFGSKDKYVELEDGDGYDYNSDLQYTDTTAPVLGFETEDTVYFDEETQPEDDTTEEWAPETEAAKNDNRRVVVANGGLRLRNAPDLSGGAVVGLIPNGTIIEVVKFENNWAYTLVGGVWGWCSCDYLFVPYEYTGDPISVAKVTKADGALILSDQYEGADLLRTTVPAGETLYVYTVEGDRAYVSYNYIYGWCNISEFEITYEY